MATLTPRQEEVLERRLSGFGRSRTAQDLGIAPSTVKTHSSWISIKIGGDVSSILEYAAASGMGMQPRVGYYAPLSQRQREVLDLMMQGLTPGQIADKLTIELSTVRGHATNIYERFGLKQKQGRKLILAVLIYMNRSEEDPGLYASIGLTDREKETLGFYCQGYSYMGIAEKLGFSVQTAKNQVAKIRQKTGSTGLEQLIEIAEGLGISTTPAAGSWAEFDQAEKEFLKKSAEGMGNKQIARDLRISEHDICYGEAYAALGISEADPIYNKLHLAIRHLVQHMKKAA